MQIPCQYIYKIETKHQIIRLYFFTNKNDDNLHEIQRFFISLQSEQYRHICLFVNRSTI